MQACGKGPFGWPALSLGADTLDGILAAQGLERATDDTNTAGVVFFTPERAILELCDETPGSALVHEVNALMQGLATLRPQLVSALLEHCGSVKAKRLFLALADRHRHAWLANVNLQKFDLGSGKRVLVPAGRLNVRYQITLPADLDEHVG